MLRTQIPVLPTVLPIGDADLRVGGYCRIQLFIGSIAETYFSRLGNKDNFFRTRIRSVCSCNRTVSILSRCRRICRYRYTIITDLYFFILQIIIGKSDPVDIAVGNLLLRDSVVALLITLVETIHGTHIGIIDGVEVTYLHRLYNI